MEAMNVVGLADVMSEILAFSKPTAQVIARFGRESDMLSNKGRGRNVASATARDAAYLTIAMMLSPKPAHAVRYMLDFGELRSVGLFEHFAECVDLRPIFEPGHRFVDGLAALYHGLGSPEFVATIWPGFGVSHGEVLLPPIDISISETELTASIDFGNTSFGYEHPSIQKVDMDLLFHSSDDTEQFKQKEYLVAAIKAADDARALYARPVKATMSIELDQVLLIAEALNGVSFRDLVGEHSRQFHSGEAMDVLP
jgi:hypothetical protein